MYVEVMTHFHDMHFISNAVNENDIHACHNMM